MKHFLAALGIIAAPLGAGAAETGEIQLPPMLDISADARADWQMVRYDGHTDNSNTGFEGKYLMVMLNGEIIDGLTYAWRQRFNKFSKDSNFFDATDWIYIDYRFKDWSLRGGKDVVAIGGWEYDANPINIYAASLFWNNIACYQWGISGAFHIGQSDKITAQITQSPFFTTDNRNMYAYNIMWSGNHGAFSALYSANLVEYSKGKYISYISLGNRFAFGLVNLELDLMNRASSGQTFFFKDFSVMAQLGWDINSRWSIKGKYTYDVNNTTTDADLTVRAGSELSMDGGVVEFYPLKKKRTSLRLHAGCWYAWGKNSNSADMLQDKTLFVSTGLTWYMDIFKLNRKTKN